MPTPLAQFPVRRLTLRDLTACADLGEDRDWPRTEHAWGLLLTAGTGYGIDDPDADGTSLIATCTLTTYGADAPHAPAYAVVGMVLVAERHARQGLGLRLLRHALARAGDAQVSLYATEEGRGLYARLGFTAGGRAETLRGHFRSAGPPPSIATRPATPADLTALIRLDTEVFGHDRTAMIARLPAFADQLRVAEDRTGLLGYAAAWPDRHTQTVGPLIARDTDTAKALVASLASGTDRPLRIDVDEHHTQLCEWLRSHGLATAARQTVMTYGAPGLPGDPHRRFAPLSKATG
ncbi:GNAT family N-acetyltransferase [Streptomyces candidus]|uniref:GNAT superfamily N-acetyltransferase n=1 Tax=Streptomyces candidus TaxID=67283 RepID=A0A7X0HGL5_9ACTN|nr:GNAT family N-acetyltransferase [Streptomyces candidus]MBB6437271.1 GNAT superfamily N-acetyltransferase [Streptomyces candidus]GHH38423.1 acetyltransferase [Streptomyces candidus]